MDAIRTLLPLLCTYIAHAKATPPLDTRMHSCPLRFLDISNTAVDGNALAQALSVNSSLRSLDVRMVPGTQGGSASLKLTS